MNLPLNHSSNVQSKIGRVKRFMLLAGVQWTTLDSSQPSFTLPHNPSIPILNCHNRAFDFCHLNSTHAGMVPLVLTDNYHKVLTQLVQHEATAITQRDTRQTLVRELLHTAIIFLRILYILISTHFPDNVNRLDPVLNVPEAGTQRQKFSCHISAISMLSIIFLQLVRM